MARRRTVIYDYTFEEQARLLQPDTQRLDAAIIGAEWLMSSHPEKCEQVPGTILRVVFTDRFPDMRPMRIFFSIKDANTCVAHWIEFTDRVPGEDDEI
jgi:hypothetical protein